ncbi:hypothetical protein CYMTET_32300 [Cymbomonas tetramitiformis]|uniref:Uncharacterized protein n=1 Tax=Cymbomonas tetramitiformis TaxID=36881 RepID=A0AAE0FFA9_9CHLO|nr:hypothetical protein CYMTET_32300 [Cymbomonas tetramitiformis]
MVVLMIVKIIITTGQVEVLIYVSATGCLNGSGEVSREVDWGGKVDNPRHPSRCWSAVEAWRRASLARGENSKRRASGDAGSQRARAVPHAQAPRWRPGAAFIRQSANA